jgi:DNA-binding NtrC family response regulator
MSDTTRTPWILIAADDDDLRRALCRLAARLPVAVSSAATPDQLVRILSADRPVDLLIADASLSWLGGLQAMVSMSRGGLPVATIIIETYAECGLRADHPGESLPWSDDSAAENLLSLIRSRLRRASACPTAA